MLCSLSDEPIDVGGHRSVMSSDLCDRINVLYRHFGPPKPMGSAGESTRLPHFFLLRKFLGEQDLAILFNTKRCRYNCAFCALPLKSSLTEIPADEIRAQFLYVAEEVKHALGLIDRITIANEGSVFDQETFPFDVLLEIAASTRSLPSVRRLVFETRLEFLNIEPLKEMRRTCMKEIEILTGFESADKQVRDVVLSKREPLDVFLRGLDIVGESKSALTAYVLFKPIPNMSDQEAIDEARSSIAFLREACALRQIPITIRLNPMYAAQGTRWRSIAESSPSYSPPRLSDVLEVAREARARGTPTYIGLTSEGLAEIPFTYRGREDFSSSLLREAILNNTRTFIVTHT